MEFLTFLERKSQKREAVYQYVVSFNIIDKVMFGQKKSDQLTNRLYYLVISC